LLLHLHNPVTGIDQRDAGCPAACYVESQACPMPPAPPVITATWPLIESKTFNAIAKKGNAKAKKGETTGMGICNKDIWTLLSLEPSGGDSPFWENNQKDKIQN
jgi:hypothetical protein